MHTVGWLRQGGPLSASGASDSIVATCVSLNEYVLTKSAQEQISKRGPEALWAGEAGQALFLASLPSCNGLRATLAVWRAKLKADGTSYARACAKDAKQLSKLFKKFQAKRAVAVTAKPAAPAAAALGSSS